MPELPEVETVCRGLAASIEGLRVEEVTLRRDGLRTPFPKNFKGLVEGRRIARIGRRAKYILMELEDDGVMLAHLGMSGRMVVHHATPNRYDTHDHAVFHFDDGKTLVFNDARRFGILDYAKKHTLAKHPLFAHLGPEPLEKEFFPAYLKQALSTRKSPVKTAIMDQELVVGVGNIYASEALFDCGISPLAPAHKAAGKVAPLVASIQKTLQAAIVSGGSTLRDYVRSSGDEGYFQHEFKVYGREGEPCFTCATPITRITQAGRSTFYCKTCQT